MTVPRRLAWPAGRSIYFGWWMVVACNLVAFVTWGVGIFNQGVFLGYFVETYGWSRTELSLGSTIFFVWAGLGGIVVGRILDRWGPRPTLIGGAVLIAIGVAALGLVRQPWQVLPAFLILGTGYTGIHTVTLGAIVARWFARDRARAMAAATLGGSLGGMILVPLNAAILERFGAPAAGLTLAAVAIVLIVPLAIWFIHDRPEDLGLRLDGDAPDQASTVATRSAAFDPHWALGAAIRTRAFWAIAIAFHLTMIAQGGFLVHQVLFLRTHFDFLTAASVVSATTIAGTLGRFVFFVVGNRWAPRWLASGVLLMQAAGLALSAFGGADVAIVLGSVIFGATMGISITLQPVITAECFGRQSFGRIYGPIYTGIQLGSGIGPLLYGALAGATGSYQAVLLLVAGGLGIASGLIQFAVPPPIDTRPAGR